jgi:hypothetical protein
MTDPPVLISPGLVTSVQIDVVPIEGTGTLDLTLNWTKFAYPNPYIEAFLTPLDSTTAEPLGFTLSPPGNPETGTYTDVNRATGCYLLTLQLRVDTGLIWGTGDSNSRHHPTSPPGPGIKRRCAEEQDL